MATINKVAIFGASGNFGTPITAALSNAGFDLTIISRVESISNFPPGLRVIKTAYTVDELTKALSGQDAVVCVVGPGGIVHQATIADAAENAGVKRFIIDDFGWGPEVRGLPQFAAVHAQRRAGWDHAKAKAEANSNFTWTGISSGNPVDWALKRFPTMGFNLTTNAAIIYDSGTEAFTGTTLEGIGQSVVGVLQNPTETANRFVKVLSIRTCQNELLEAFQTATSANWEVQRSTTKELMEGGVKKFETKTAGWVLDLAVAQLLDEGEARCVVAPSWNESHSEVLGVRQETALEVVSKVLKAA